MNNSFKSLSSVYSALFEEQLQGHFTREAQWQCISAKRTGKEL